MKRYFFFIFLVSCVLFNRSLYSQSFVSAWQVTNNFNATGRAVITDDAGNLYQTGVFSNTADFDPGIGVTNLTSHGNVDAFVAKFDSAGSLIWARNFGAANIDQGFDVSVDRFGNVYTSGYFRDSIDCDPGSGTYYLNGNGNNDAFLCKLDSNGNFLWANGWGGPLTTYPYSIATNKEGITYVTGYFDSSVDFNPGPGIFTMTAFGSRDCFVSKFDASGNFIWAKQLGGTSADEGNEILIDENDDVIIAGSFATLSDFDPGPGNFNLTSGGGINAFICKLTSSGNFVWAKSFTSSGQSFAEGIVEDADNNLYFTGHFITDVDADPGATTQTFISNSGSADVMVVKLDSLADFIWAKQIGGISLDYAYDIRTGHSENVFICGTFFSTVDFDPGAGVSNFTSNGSSDNFIWQLDSAGNYVSAVSFGGPMSETVNALAIDKFCNLYATGEFYDTVDFNTGPGVFEMVAPGSFTTDAFIIKHRTCSSLNVEWEEINPKLVLYPNPSFGSFVIYTDSPITEDAIVEITDLQGKSIYKGEFITYKNNEIFISLTDVECGLYVVKLISAKNTYCKRLVIVK